MTKFRNMLIVLAVCVLAAGQSACLFQQTVIYVEDNERLVKATHKAVGYLETYLGSGFFDIRQTDKPRVKGVFNPRSTIVISLCDADRVKLETGSDARTRNRMANSWVCFHKKGVKDTESDYYTNDSALWWLVAHEIGHALGHEEHSEDKNDLMYEHISIDYYDSYDEADLNLNITDEQLEKMM